MIIPLIFLLLTGVSLFLPSYITSKNMKVETINKNFPLIQESMEALLTSGLKCTVKDAVLVCDEDSPAINEVAPTSNPKISYTIIANQKSIAIDTTVDDNKPKETDNIIVFLGRYIRIRYVIRDYVNPVEVNEILGDYTNFEGLSLEELSNELLADPDSSEEKVNDFILKAYTSTLDTQLFVTATSSFIAFSLLLLITCIMLKGVFFLNRKKGFKFSDCLKMSLTTTFPALIVTWIVSLLTGINFATIFGFIFVARIIFIYLKYIFPKNNIFVQLYEETKDERFNLQ